MALQPNMYVVRAGDTLDTVAFRYQLQPAELAALNPGITQNLIPGARINVRPGTELSAELRAAAIVPSNARSSLAQAPATASAAAPVSAPAAVASAPSTVTTVSTFEPTSNTVQAPAISPAPQPREIVITEAAFDSVTGGYPGEEVVTDEFDVMAPSNGYTPVPSADTAAATSSTWVWPTEGQVARGFAPERIGGQGVDIAGVPGQNIFAATAGTVVYSGKDPSGAGGSLVILRHAEDLMTTYSHADKLFVTEDDIVQAGDPIASLGWNEASESVLSFEVRRAGSPLDPMSFVTAR
jgi:lipoprotein NlpD